MNKILGLLGGLITGFIMFLPLTVVQANPSTTYNGHTYELIDKSMDWYDARDYCQKLGGHLAIITSSGEQAAVTELVRQGRKAQYWLGATDQDSEGNWRWVDGQRVSYWGPTVTFDNYRGVEHFLQMQRHNWGNHSYCGYWNDAPYDNHIPGEESFFSLQMIGMVCEYDR